MTTPTRLIAVAVWLASSAACTGSGGCLGLSPEPPRHVVVVVLDTLRADRLSTYGYDRPTSPALDALAAEGVRFDRAVTQAPWTRPSIGSMLTSRFPRSIGIADEKHDVLPDDVPYLPELLHDAGWRTLGVTANPNINAAWGFQRGFDTWVDSHIVFEWMDAEDADHEHIKGNGLPSAKDRFGAVLKALDDESPDAAAQPHFVLLDLMEIHEWSKPGIARPPYTTMFEGRRDKAYLRLIRQLTDDLGAFLQTLRARPGWEDATIAIVSDHGEGLFSHPAIPKSRYHGNLLYSSQLLVPWILVDDRLPAGTVVDAPVRMLELMPTVLELAGVPAPEDLDGRSVVPLARGEDVALPTGFVVETHFRGRDRIGIFGPMWHYVENRDGLNGMPRYGLHPADKMENGRKTSVADQRKKVVETFAERVQAWEAAHPVREPVRIEGPSEEEAGQLEAIGYVE